MKQLISIALLAGTTIFVSCGSGSTTTSTTTTDSTASVVKTPPDVLDTAGKTIAPAGMTDQDFVSKASGANMAEIAAHKAAATHALSADVKMHATHMLADHQKLGSELKALAGKKNWTLAADAPPDKKQMLDDMNTNMKGKDWDIAYLDGQLTDHQDAISLFETGSASVKDSDLKALIDKTLPTLRNHLQMVRDAQAKLAK